MCGRYFFDPDDYQELLAAARFPAEEFKGGEVYPNSKAPVLLADKSLHLLRWGRPWSGGKGGSLLHARAESVREKSTFAPAFREQRCMIPTSGYYEWQHIDGKSQRGQKYFFYNPETPRLYLAGLVLAHPDGPCFVIITREAGAFMTDIHDRMPLLLARDEVAPWLGNSTRAEEILLRPQMELARAYKGV